MSLAITEKRPQRRHGGCASIFFQLIDWNRRFAKKKLFSKKLLPPVRTTKRPTKKFGGNETMPMTKHMLIANENRGGFPSVKKVDVDEVSGNCMRAPGLVARLMGLESIPLTDHEKPRKALDSELYYDRDESGEYSRLDQDLCDEVAGQGKLDSFRPQKLQKTRGFLERHPVNAVRFSPDFIHRGVVARSRKQQHKLPSSVKSPRFLSRGNQARLMQAATKILEPGLQPRSRSRRAISLNGISELEGLGSESTVALKRSKEPQNDFVIGPCRSCGKTVELSQLRCGVMEPFVSHNVSAASNFSSVLSLDCSAKDHKVHNGTSLFSVREKFDNHGKARDSMEKKQSIGSDRLKCKLPPQVASKSMTLRKAELPMSRNNMVHRSKLCCRRQIDSDANKFMASKHFVGAKKNLNSSSGLKSASKVSSSNGVSSEGNIWETSLSRKRRSSTNLQTDNVTVSKPSFMKRRSDQSDIANRKESGLIFGKAINRDRAKSEPQKRVNVETLSSGDEGIVSFTFNSPIKHNSLSSVKEATSGKSVDQMEPKDGTFDHPKMLSLNTKKEILPSLRGKFSLRGDELSNLLEKKIRELDSLDQVETGIRDATGRSTASILEELVSALTTGEPVVQSIHHAAESEIRANPFNAAFIDNNHPSPTSIFDASFSSETCSVGSINGSFDLKESKALKDPSHKCNKKELLDLEADLLDSANSVELSRSDDEKIMNSVPSDIFVGALGTKFSFSNQAVSKTKFLLKSILFFDSDSKLQPSVNFLLYDIFDSISDAFFTRMKSSLSLSEPNDYNHINDFLFEFLIESLVLRYNQFCMSGYKVWLKLPVLLNKEQLLKEIYGEIERFMELSGKVLDDLAEQELSSSNIRWTTFDAETSLTAIDIETVILRELVDEMFMDLLVIN